MSAAPDAPLGPPIKLPPQFSAGGRFYLGLDFGTHSTKAVLRLRGTSQLLVPFLDAQRADYPPFASPSLVRLCDGRLIFGASALGGAGGELFEALKLELLPGTAGAPRRAAPPETRPELLVALYLAWVLGRVRAALGVAENQFSVNLAAPMNHIESAPLRASYERVVHAAWRATFGPNPVRVFDGVPLAAVRERFEALLASALPAFEERRFRVWPETLAPLVSASLDPQFNHGFYMMLDVGAGTTECSVSYLREHSADQQVWCAADESELLGANHFHTNDRRECTTVREKEEAQLRCRVSALMRLVWYAGYQKDMDFTRYSREQWKRITVLLTGGGLRRASLRRHVECHEPQECCFKYEHGNYWVKWHEPSGFAFGEPLPRFDEDDPCATLTSTAYLAVANGLALESAKWPQFFPPSEYPPLGSSCAPITYPWQRNYHESDVA